MRHASPPAPCAATPRLKQESELAKLTALQARLLDRAAELVKPGGTLVYCTCSLEPEEGEQTVEALLARNPQLSRRPIVADEIAGIAGIAGCVTPQGDLRTLPSHWPDPEPRMSGLDGFFAARIVKA
jgi:16S rRNA (cytosine967-C5)-methyltransferase